jgi:hypothetical protein
MRRPVLYTIGHSTRPIDEFLALLEAHGIEKMVLYPGSARQVARSGLASTPAGGT